MRKLDGGRVRIGITPLAIDILTDPTGVSFDEIWRNRQRLRFGSLRFSVLAPREPIMTKRACGRPKVLADLALLEDG